MASAEEIAWAAGLFEGEGCIATIFPWDAEPDVQVALAMTDEDVVRRFDAVVNRGRVYGPYHPPSAGPRRKPFWRWMAMGDAGHDVVEMLGPWLMTRRRAQARERGILIPGVPIGHVDFPWK